MSPSATPTKTFLRHAGTDQPLHPHRGNRKGYGSYVLRRLFTSVKTAGYDRITLWVLKDNRRAIAFYRHFGFTHDGFEMSLPIQGPILENPHVTGAVNHKTAQISGFPRITKERPAFCRALLLFFRLAVRDRSPVSKAQSVSDGAV